MSKLPRKRCLVVLSVISGRNFIDNPSTNIIVEAKLDREVLSTDPVPHCPNPNFEQELAWEVDCASLRQYRLQRASVKLQIFSVQGTDSPSTRENLGYVILDIRSATERKTFKWFPVLNSKFRPAPEIFSGLYIDPCSIGTNDIPNDLCVAPLSVRRFVEKFENQIVDGFQLTESDFFPISTQECYLISVVLVSIRQISQILPKNFPYPSKFKLSLRFLGNDLYSWEFSEGDFNKLSSNQCKFLIHSSMDAVKGCFLQPNLLEIGLCADDKQIGYCHGNLPLISDQINPNTQYPFCVDSTFTLNSLQNVDGDCPVILRFNVAKCDNQPVHLSPTSSVNDTNSPRLNMELALAQMQNKEDPASQSSPSQRPSTSQMPINCSGQASGQLRRFCYVIELKTIQAYSDIPLSKDIFVYAKYVYPLFGTTNPIMTLPPVRLSSTEEKHFSQGYCAFELAADFNEFQSRLLEEPLNVEILSRSPEAADGVESSLGWAVIPLGEVFSRPLINMTNACRRSKESVAEVKLNGGPIAQIRYSLILDDFGVFNSFPAVETNKYEDINSGDVKMVTENGRNKSPSDIRQTSEYRTALELELWKAKEEERFKDTLKHREQRMLMVFAQEWKRREDERESMCKRKIHEYQVLEDKLRSVLEDLMDRERQLNAKETNLTAIHREIERKIELRERDFMDGVQRKVREAEQALVSEQQRNLQLNSELNFLRDRCQSLEERLATEQQLKATAATTTQSTVQAIDTREIIDRSKRDEEEIRRLQFELVRLTTEMTTAQSQISSLEQKLDGALRGRLRYKELWTRALEEVTRLRQDLANATKLELQRKEAEVEGLRREQSLILRTGSCMNLRNNSGQNNGDRAQRMEGVTSTIPDNPQVPVLEAKLKRLREEKQNLLSSGVYYEDDELIMDLDKEIQRLQVDVTNVA